MIRIFLLASISVFVFGCAFTSATKENLGSKLQRDNGKPIEKLITTHYCVFSVATPYEETSTSGDCTVALYEDELYFYHADFTIGMYKRALQIKLKDITSTSVNKKSEQFIKGEIYTNYIRVSFHVINSLKDSYGKQEVLNILSYINNKIDKLDRNNRKLAYLKEADQLPMYGQPELERPESKKKADEKFIKKAIKKYGSSQSASKKYWSLAEDRMNKRKIEAAMIFYNESWLLDQDNYQPYWGFARVMLERDDCDNAVKFIEKAENLHNNSDDKAELLSDMGSIYSYKGKNSKSFFVKANNKFLESTIVDPSYANTWRRWAYSLYEQGNYKGAWEKVLKAESLNAKPFPGQFIFDLESKEPRPK